MRVVNNEQFVGVRPITYNYVPKNGQCLIANAALLHDHIDQFVRL